MDLFSTTPSATDEEKSYLEEEEEEDCPSEFVVVLTKALTNNYETRPSLSIEDDDAFTYVTYEECLSKEKNNGFQTPDTFRTLTSIDKIQYYNDKSSTPDTPYTFETIHSFDTLSSHPMRKNSMDHTPYTYRTIESTKYSKSSRAASPITSTYSMKSTEDDNASFLSYFIDSDVQSEELSVTKNMTFRDSKSQVSDPIRRARLKRDKCLTLLRSIESALATKENLTNLSTRTIAEPPEEGCFSHRLVRMEHKRERLLQVVSDFCQNSV
jgi:hypothetical protein